MTQKKNPLRLTQKLATTEFRIASPWQGEVDAFHAAGEGPHFRILLSRSLPHLYLSEERSERFLSRREKFNAGTPAKSHFCTQAVAGVALRETSP